MTGRRHPGIDVLHSAGCRALSEGRCSCTPRFRAEAYDKRTGRRIRRTFDTLAAAKAWRADAQGALRRRTMQGPTGVLLRDLAADWLQGATNGTIRTRSGHEYKPSALRGYAAELEARILPALGGRKMEDIARADVQYLVDTLLAAGLSPSTIRNALMPLRVIYRRAVARGVVAVNPTTGLELPAQVGKRDRIVSPAQAQILIAALPEWDQAVWATALYAGLRAGELQALDWGHVDLAGGVISVERAYDRQARRFIPPKSQAAVRRIPLASVLRDHLISWKVNCGRDSGLVFGDDGQRPVYHPGLLRRAAASWRQAGLEGLSLHDARHTFASIMIAAGVNAKALSVYMGHANITITFDRYGHLMPGSEHEAAVLLDTYLSLAGERSRAAGSFHQEHQHAG